MSNIRISVVDDHPIFRHGIRDCLEDFSGYDLLSEAPNGLEFIESLNAVKPDVVLLDIDMPVMDGHETVDYLKQHHPEIKILMMTNHVDSLNAYELLKRGIHGFLAKDTIGDDLIAAINDVVQNGYHFNEHLTIEMWQSLFGELEISGKTGAGKLSLRQQHIVALVCHEYSNKEIADELCLSVRTVENHRYKIAAKIKASNIVGVVLYGLKHCLHFRFLPRLYKK